MRGPTNPLSQQIHSEKYRADGESFEESVNRVASALKDSDEHFHQLREILGDMRFLPGGRIQAAAGSGKNTTMYNCFVSPTIEDSFVEGENSIMDVAKYAATTMRMGGGIGYDFSSLRPRGDRIRKLHSYSSGPIAFMDIFDAVCRTVASSGHRRGAQMGVLRVDHPDIIDFIHAKQNTTRLTGFNISIAITDEFMHAVRDDLDFPLRFDGKVYRYVNARELWEQIMRSTWDWAEPGVLFIDRIAEMNNLYYCEKISATNPCVVGSTKILTDKGWATIESLWGEEVRVFNGSGWSNVVVHKTGENQEVFDAVFTDGTRLRCTPTHQFITSTDNTCDLTAVDQLGMRLKDWVPPVVVGGENDYFPGEDEVPLFGYSPKARARWLTKCFQRHCPYMTMDVKPGQIGVFLQFWSHEMANDVLLLLQSLGVRSYITEDSGCFCLRIPSSEVQLLIDRGVNIPQDLTLNTEYRLPQIMVASCSSAGRADVFCFYEPQNGCGIFNGVLTKQCGEQPLPPNGACLLGSFNLTRYVSNGKFDFEQFELDIPAVIRAMDNVVDRTVYPLVEQKAEAKEKRRMGIGVTGVANAIESLGHEYGSDGFCEMLSKILEFLRDHAYHASSDLAAEKGSFPALNIEKYLEGEFVKQLPEYLRNKIRSQGIRNSHLLSIAPTGTISLCADNVSSGIEPVFAYRYDRTIQKFGGPEVVTVEDYGVAKFGHYGKIASSVTVGEHLKVLLTAQKYVDSSVSKTCNVPSDCSWEDFKKVYVDAWAGGAKGCTTFRIGGKRFGILAAQEEGTKPASCRIDPESGRRECE